VVFGGFDPAQPRHAPHLGQHSDELLQELGLGPAAGG
jgi:crotonobetainyl-CoA:carnitine CoA-transferase CaiB-like acyl-CoA transferase